MSPLPVADVIGVWLGIFLTLSILSFLYKDNPFYKLAEHLFVGVSLGYVIVKQYYDNLRPNLLDHLGAGQWVYLVTLALVVMLFVRSLSRRLAWVGRYPLAIVVALYAATQVNGVAESDLAQQIKISAQPVNVPKVDLNQPLADEAARAAWRAELGRLPGLSPAVVRRIDEARQRGQRFASVDDIAALPGLSPLQREDLAAARGGVQGLEAQAGVRPGEQFWFGTVSRLLLLIGVCASLIYFYFSVPHTGMVGRISRVGVWVLMLGFGASFGLTVQGRLSLAVGRAVYLLGRDRPPPQAAQVHAPLVTVICLVIIVVGLALWERRQSRSLTGS